MDTTNETENAAEQQGNDLDLAKHLLSMLQQGMSPFLQLTEEEFNVRLLSIQDNTKNWMIEHGKSSDGVEGQEAELDRAIATCLIFNQLSASLWFTILKTLAGMDNVVEWFENEENEKFAVEWSRFLFEDMKIQSAMAPLAHIKKKVN